MADITMPNDFVPEQADPFGGAGPMAAAQGNIGGLQQALVQRSQGQRPALSADKVNQFNDSLMSRIRSPDQMQQAASDRKGALTALQEANSMPVNDWSSGKYIAQAISDTDKPWDVGYGFRKGVSNAMQADKDKQGLARLAAIENAKQAMGFGTNEEKIASGDEKAVMGDVAKMASASIRGPVGSAGKNNGFLNTSEGLVNTNDIDENGKPKLVIPKDKLSRLYNDALARATKIAESPENQMNFNSPEEREQWIQMRAAGEVKLIATSVVQGQLSQGAAPQAGQTPAPVPAMPVPSAPQTAPMPNQSITVKTPPGGNLTDGVGAKTKVDFTNLPPEVMQAMEKDAPEAYAATADAMLQNGQALPGSGAQVTPTDTSQTKPVMVDKVTQAGQIEGAKENEKLAATRADSDYFKPAEQGRSMIAAVNELKNLPFNSGSFAEWKKGAGNVLSSLGYTGNLAKEANNITDASRLLQRLSNDRISQEKGVQTYDDEVRIRKQFANITDPQASYNFMLDNMRESSERAMERAELAKAVFERDRSYKNANSEWDSHLKNDLGKTFINYGGNLLFRHQFINDSVAANPGKDPEAIKLRAAQEWLKLSKTRN